MFLFANTFVPLPSSHPAPSTQPTQPSENATKTTTVDNSALLFIVIPVGFTIIVLGGIIVVTVCILIRVKRMATKAARSRKPNRATIAARSSMCYSVRTLYTAIA